MTLFSNRYLCICFFLVGYSIFTWFSWNNNYLIYMCKMSESCRTTIRHSTDSAESPASLNSSIRYTFNLSHCWTDSHYQLWKHGKLFPLHKTRGSIVYMVMTGNLFLRSRCDVIMCTFGITLHPSRIVFVGETSSDSRLPIYDVVTSETPRPVNRAGSMQKLARGLVMLVQMIAQSSYKDEIQWIMVMDDDTFVSPPNLELLISKYDAKRPLMIGQSTCGVGFCGGAGYAISRALFNQFPSFIEKCQPRPGVSESDQFVPQCIMSKIQVEIINRKEFNSQPPDFYSTEDGYKDHPDGFGRAVSFHYIRPASKYVMLWRLHQAYMKAR